MKKIAFSISILLLSGCSGGPTRDNVIADVETRSGFTMPKETAIGQITLPPGASLVDGITEDEAVSIALWNNAAFQETLVNLDVARGDLIQAGLLPNPIGSYTFQATNKPFKYALELPLEALWLRPFRINAAEAEAERVSHQLSQAGLNVIRDTRRAYSDLLQSQTQLKLLEESLSLRRHIAEMAEKRYAAGDISSQETSVAYLDAVAAEQATARGRYDIKVNEERLRFAMGIGSDVSILKLDPVPLSDCKAMDIAALVEEGIKNRPDALAAQLATAAAEERSNLSLFSWLGVSGVLDATSGKKSGHEFSPGVRGTVPIFNVNQGNIKRANAEEERAARGEQTVGHQIRLDIIQSYTQYQQACTELGILQSKVRAGVQTDLSRVEKAYASGDVPYLMVLQSSRSVIDTRLRETQLIGDVRRALSELERSVGKKLSSVPAAEAAPKKPDTLDKQKAEETRG